MKKLFQNAGLLALLLLLLCAPFVRAQSQENDFYIRLDKNYGYNGFGGDIQGTFTIIPKSEISFESIEYFIDDNLVERLEREPFRLRFRTEDYSLGIHSIHAVGYDDQGKAYESNRLKMQFVSASEGWKTVMTIVVPILAFSFLMVWGLPLISGKKKIASQYPGEPISYGLWGGVICNRCARPFKRHFWGINLGVGRLERCPHCGSWSITRQASPTDLAEAETRWAAEAREDSLSLEMQKKDIERSIEESRYFEE